MKIDLRIYILIVLLSIPAALSAQSIKLNVTYVCSGEHIYIDYCASEADTARCTIAHPDKLYHGGLLSPTTPRLISGRNLSKPRIDIFHVQQSGKPGYSITTCDLGKNLGLNGFGPTHTKPLESAA